METYHSMLIYIHIMRECITKVFKRAIIEALSYIIQYIDTATRGSYRLIRNKITYSLLRVLIHKTYDKVRYR